MAGASQKRCHTSWPIGVISGDDGEKLRLPRRSSLEDEERELITSLYTALRRIAAVAGSVDIEPDDLVQEALMRALRKGPLTDLDNPLAYLRGWGNSGRVVRPGFPATTRPPTRRSLLKPSMKRLPEGVVWMRYLVGK